MEAHTMFRTLIAVALGLTLVLAAMPAMARDVPPTTPPPTPAKSPCEVLGISIEAAAASGFEPTDARGAWITASLADCPGLRESLSATAQAWLEANGI